MMEFSFRDAVRLDFSIVSDQSVVILTLKLDQFPKDHKIKKLTNNLKTKY